MTYFLITNPLRLDFPLKTPLPEKSKPIKTKPALRKKPIKGIRPVQKGTNEEHANEKSRPAPPLKRPIMKANAEGKAKPPPLKRPLMKKKGSDEEKKGEDKYETKLTGKSDTKIGEGLIDKFEESIGFDVKFLNDDSHIEEKIKK